MLVLSGGCVRRFALDAWLGYGSVVFKTEGLREREV